MTQPQQQPGLNEQAVAPDGVADVAELCRHDHANCASDWRWWAQPEIRLEDHAKRPTRHLTAVGELRRAGPPPHEVLLEGFGGLGVLHELSPQA